MPLGASTTKEPVCRLGGAPWARAKARENAAVEPGSAAIAASPAVAPWASCQAAR
jgi:hypothetical protein